MGQRSSPFLQYQASRARVTSGLLSDPEVLARLLVEEHGGVRRAALFVGRLLAAFADQTDRR